MMGKIWLALAIATAAACGGAAPNAPASSAVGELSQAEARRGLDRPCASSEACPGGYHCSTEDGACDRPPGCGPDDICPAVCYGACVKTRKCRADAECRTFSDYCAGCDCRALSVHDPDPVCGGPGVMCFADPCTTKRATCAEGRCALTDTAPEVTPG